jgi:hypothetical protein
MTIRKQAVIACAFLAIMFVASNAFSQACSSGATILALGVGSSAQFNALAYAAEDAILAEGGGVTWNQFSFKSSGTDFGIADDAPSLAGYTAAPVLDSGNWFVAWDSNATCNVYAYVSEDSGVGVRCFQQSAKVTGAGAKTFEVGACYPVMNACVENAGGNNCTEPKFTDSIVGGLPDTQTFMPTNVYNALTLVPDNAVQVSGALPQPYCGVLNKSAGFYCSFNFAGTDIRPEDALYAVTRALSAQSSTNSLAGLGYAQAGCGAATTPKAGEVGCELKDAFGQGKNFNVLNFALSGADPIDSGTVPSYTTISVGASPVIVFVNNADTSNFGATATDVYGNVSYVFRDVLDKKLAEVFEGTAFCTGDLRSDGSGTGVPIQVVQREPLSGTYNTFEFTGVRTQYGSATTAVGQNKISSTTWITDNESGQELFVNPTLNWTSNANCSTTGTVANIPCGDPLAIYSGPNPSSQPSNANGCSTSSTTLTGGAPLRLRAIGTSEEVPAGLGQYNSTTDSSSNTGTPFNIVDGIGYAFWSYGNFNPVTVGQTCSTTNPVTCGAYDGHYITVSGVDPLFYSEGGEADPNNNPNGPFNLPQCNLKSLPCTIVSGSTVGIPFPHIYDGKYPLWSLLRLVTFETVSGKYATPPGVINLAAYDQNEVFAGTRNTADFVPFLKNLTNSGSLTAPVWTGNLNLWVFRSHYLQSKIDPYNGHAACNPGGLSTSTSVNLLGGTSAAKTCLVDLGGDVGGVQLTVQDDLDFNLYFGGVSIPPTAPQEIYGLHD